MWTKGLIVRKDRPAKLEIEIKLAVNLCHVRDEITWFDRAIAVTSHI